MNIDPIFFPIITPIKHIKNVIIPIAKHIGTISILKKAKLTPIARASILVAIDNINRSAGKEAVTVASVGSNEILSRSDYRSPRYTTSWDELPIVK